MKRVMTYGVAHAAAWDAGNRNMSKCGRTEWNEEDYTAAVAEFDRLLPIEGERAGEP